MRLTLALATAVLAVCSVGLCADDSTRHVTFFHQQVEPILVGHCLECHGGEKQGGLDLRSRATGLFGGDSTAAIVPGKPDQSLVYTRVINQEMPPEQPLSAAQAEVLRDWIASGAWFPEQPLDPFAISTEQRGVRLVVIATAAKSRPTGS